MELEPVVVEPVVAPLLDVPELDDVEPELVLLLDGSVLDGVELALVLLLDVPELDGVEAGSVSPLDGSELDDVESVPVSPLDGVEPEPELALLIAPALVSAEMELFALDVGDVELLPPALVSVGGAPEALVRDGATLGDEGTTVMVGRPVVRKGVDDRPARAPLAT